MTETTEPKRSTHVLVRFLEDKLFYVCLRNHVKSCDEEDGVVSAKYRSSYYPAIVLGEGGTLQVNNKENPLAEDIPKDIMDEFTTSPGTTKRRKLCDVKSPGEVQRLDVAGGIWEETPSRRHCVELQTQAQAASKPAVKKQLFQDELHSDIALNKFDVSEFNILDYAIDDNLVMTDLQNCMYDSTNVLSHYEQQHQSSFPTDTDGQEEEPHPIETTIPTEDFNVTKKGGKKKYFCIFCKKLVTNFPRHLISNHAAVDEVKILTSLEPNSQERKNLIRDLRGKGTIFFNTSEEINKGSLIVSRRQQNKDTSLCKPCPNCNNYFSKTSLYKHYKKCKNGNADDMRQLQSSSTAAMIQPLLDGKANSSMTSVILPGMFNDDIFDIIKKDPLIIEYGNYLCTKLKLSQTHLKNSIRTRLRQVGSLLKTIIDLQPNIQKLQDAIQPQNFDIFLEAVRKAAGYCSKKGTFRAPSLVTQLGNNIKTCAERVIVYSIKTENDDLKQKTSKWLELFDHEYYNVLGKPALEDAASKKWNKPRLLPTTEDIMKLNKYVKTCADEAEKTLKSKFNKHSFDTLNKSLLIIIMLFNRKRVGESERLLLADYLKRQHVQNSTELFNSLSNTEKIIANSFTRVEIRGKKGRPVPILIRHDIADKIEVLLSHRKTSGVPDNNKYLFARGTTYYNAGRALREAAWECGAVRPELITGTQLRKEIASTSQALNFTNTDMKNLADYMGHHGDVHDMFYRMPSDVIHLAKISQLLIAIDEGRISEFYGKSLDEINVDIDVGESVPQMHEQQAQEQPGLFHASKTDELSSIMPQSVELPSTSGCSGSSWVVHTENPPQKRTFKSDSLKHKKTKIFPKKNSDERKKWTTPERHQVRKLFSDNIQDGFMPSRFECKQAIQSCPELKQRTVTQLKTWVYYEHKRNQKKKNQQSEDNA